MYVLSKPSDWTTPDTLQLRCLMKRVWAKLSNTIHCTYGQLFVFHCASNCHPDKDIPETKTFQARQLCLLCGCKNDGNAVARSILLISKVVRKQSPLKIKN